LSLGLYRARRIRALLGRTYDLKSLADYETGPGSHISPERSREAIDRAKQFVECVTSLIPPSGQAPERPPEPDRSR
jgi:hypothetical protein